MEIISEDDSDKNTSVVCITSENDTDITHLSIFKIGLKKVKYSPPQVFNAPLPLYGGYWKDECDRPLHI